MLNHTQSDHILQHMSDGYLSVNRNQVITDANTRFERYHGPREELIGQSIWSVMPELIGEATEFNIRRALETGEVCTYEEFNPKFGLWYDIRIIPTADGLSIFYNDITERKNKERQLTESETKFRRLAESDILGIVRFDENGQWLEANEAILQLLGFSRDELDKGILSSALLTPPEWESIDQTELLNLKNHGYMKPYEKEFFKRDGTRVPVLMSAAGLGHDMVGGMAYILDLSMRKSSEERIRLSSEAAGIAFWDWNTTTGEVEWTNPWPFFSQDQLKNMNYNYIASTDQFFGSVHPDDRNIIQTHVAQAITLRIPYRCEFRIFTPDGRMHWVQGYGRVFFDKSGKPYRLVGTNIDITHIKMASQALQESEQKFKRLANELEESHARLDIALSVNRMSIWETDFMTMQGKNNQNYYRMFGLTSPPPAWDFDTFLACVHPEDRQAIAENIQRSRLGGSFRNDSFEFRVIWPDGSIHWIYSRAHTFPSAVTGQPDRLMGAAVEITDLKETQIKLEQAVSIRDEFLSVASHELRTPITSLNLQTQILQRLMKSEALGPEELRVRKHLDAMNSQIKKLASLVDDLLDVTRIANGKLILLPEKFDLSELVRGIYQTMQEHFINTKCQVNIVSDGEAIGIWDRQKIEQVVVNLLTNACKYGRGRPIQIFILRNNGMARLVVKDTGIGISKEYQTRIFDRFERAVRGAAISGLGLGLFISKQIVSAHGGTIEVHSEEGVGSAFTVDLPMVEVASKERSGAS